MFMSSADAARCNKRNRKWVKVEKTTVAHCMTPVMIDRSLNR